MKLKLGAVTLLIVLSNLANAAEPATFQAKRNLFANAYEPFIEEVAGKNWSCTTVYKDGSLEKLQVAKATTQGANVILKSVDKKGNFNWGIVYRDDARGITVNSRDIQVRNAVSGELEGYRVQRVLRQTDTLDLIEEVVVSVNDAKVAARNKKLSEDKDPMIKSLYALVQSQKGPKSLALNEDGEVAFYTHCKAVK